VKLLVFGPLEEEPRHNSFGVASQDHISFWTENDFKELGLKTELLPDFHHEEGKVFPAVWACNYLDIKLPKVSFVLPTMGTRPEGLERCLNSIKALDYPQDKIEVIVKKDNTENRIGVPKLVKHGVQESTGEWVVFVSDDTELTPQSIVEALKIGKDGFVAFNTGDLLPDGGNRCEHFMIRKDIIAKIGEVFDTDFYHVGCDNLLAAKMDKLGIFARAEKAIVRHYHFSTGAKMDKTYETAWSHVQEDRELLKKKLAEL
jgi:GT2 family glycosyltransferase